MNSNCRKTSRRKIRIFSLPCTSSPDDGAYLCLSLKRRPHFKVARSDKISLNLYRPGSSTKTAPHREALRFTRLICFSFKLQELNGPLRNQIFTNQVTTWSLLGAQRKLQAETKTVGSINQRAGRADEMTRQNGGSKGSKLR